MEAYERKSMNKAEKEKNLWQSQEKRSDGWRKIQYDEDDEEEVAKK